MDFPKVEEQLVVVGNRLGLRHATERYKGLVNPDTGHLYGIVGNNYKTLSHETAFGMILDTLREFPEYGTPSLSPLFLKDGARMIGTIRFPEVQLPIVKDDMVNPEIQVYNSYDGGWKYEIGFGAYIVKCANGAKVFEKIVQYSRKHSQDVYIPYIREILHEGLKHFSEQTEIWRTWADKTITEAQAHKVIEDMEFGKRETQKLSQEIELRTGITTENQGTWNQFVLFMLLTQFITHNVKSEIRKRALATRLSQTLT